LRVDERSHPTSISGIDGPSDPWPEVPCPPDIDDGGSTVVYFGDAALVREAFAIALHAVGIELRAADVVPRDQSEQGE
jgi:hypothetical protein